MSSVLCLAMTPENAVSPPDNIKPHISTSRAWDNIDRLEGTLSSVGMTHRVNSIAIQARHLGPDLPPAQVTPVITKSKQRSLEVISECHLLIYNAGERCGPPPRFYVEVSWTEIQRNAWKKNILCILVRLHAAEKQNVCGWTGFNILVRDKIEVKKDNIGYLPTINAQGLSALQMSSNVIVLGFANVFLVCPLSLDVIVSARAGGGGGTAIYGLYWYVPLGRVWFSSSLL